MSLPIHVRSTARFLSGKILPATMLAGMLIPISVFPPKAEGIPKKNINSTVVYTLPVAQPIKGVVVDEANKPVQGATVSIKKLKIATSTNEAGRFELNVEPGTYEIMI